MPVLTTDFSPLYFIGRVNSVHPQFPQNHFCFSTPLPVVSLGTTYTFTNSSGSFTVTDELSYMAFVWYGPPLDFWQSVQWHDIVLSGEPSKATVTEPQRQDPVYLLVSIDICSTMRKEYIGDWVKATSIYNSLRQMLRFNSAPIFPIRVLINMSLWQWTNDRLPSGRCFPVNFNASKPFYILQQLLKPGGSA